MDYRPVTEVLRKEGNFGECWPLSQDSGLRTQDSVRSGPVGIGEDFRLFSGQETCWSARPFWDNLRWLWDGIYFVQAHHNLDWPKICVPEPSPSPSPSPSPV